MFRQKQIGFLALSLLLFLAPIRYAQNSQAPPAYPTIKVDVDLVLVTATVTDSQNRYVSGLGSEHFQIWEDKAEQKIGYFSSEDTPVSVGIVLDVSGSMKDKLSVARDAAVTYLKSRGAGDEFFLMEFSDRAQVIEDFTTEIGRLQNHMMFTSANGSTALFDAVYLALEKVKHGRNPRKAVLMITDGEDNHSRYRFSDVKELAKELDVQLYAIGIVDATSPEDQDLADPLAVPHPRYTGRELIEDLAALTGGRAFFPEWLSDLDDITAKIALDLNNQYVLGYVSTNAVTDGKWRKIRVKVNPPKGYPNLTVRAKTGYYAHSG